MTTNDLLNLHGQEHLIAHLETVEESTRQSLQQQLAEIDLAQIQQLWTASQHNTEDATDFTAVKPLPDADVVRQPADDASQQQWDDALQAGEQALQAGRVACVVVAGGQGTRLGFAHPKGMFPIGPVTEASLFQFFFERLVRMQSLYDCVIPYYIMTSHATHQPTLEFLEQNNYFGLDANQVKLFQQGTMPAVDQQTGQLLIAENGQLALSPDGHGGMLQALKRAGILDDMTKRGVDFLYYHQVDNPGARLADAELVGWHILNDAELTTKVASKRDAYEKMGVITTVEGKHSIVEYSDLPSEMAEATNEAGDLQFWAGNMGIHVFSRTFLERLTTAGNELPFHFANKKVPFQNANGELIKPESPNAIKLERFIFDALPAAKTSVIVEANRAEEFNPVKNAEGSDSPETSKAALTAMWHNWMKKAGYSTDVSQPIEISPLRAICPQCLEQSVSQSECEAETILLK